MLQATEDIDGYVATVIKQTNDGYKNSNVPLRLVLHCIEKANMEEVLNSTVMLYNFRQLKGRGNLKAILYH